jgi:hypothetical protein
MTRWAGVALLAFLGLTTYWHFSSRPPPPDFTGWATDTTKRVIDIEELIPGCPERDCIPPIDDPVFASIAEADGWLDARAPVAVVVEGEEARAYPLQILARHEIVNDEVGGRALAVTYCPLWNTAVLFDRVVDGEVVDFGVSGFLRHRNLVMWDRSSESLWLQATGEGLVGEGAGDVLTILPVPVMSWTDFKALAPAGAVLSRETGATFDYDLQAYAGYDPEPGFWARLTSGGADGPLRPMDRVVAMGVEGAGVAVPFRALREARVIRTEVDATEVVVFWAEGTATVLDQATVADSRDVGAAGAFFAEVEGRRLRFSPEENGRFRDDITGSTWSVTGVAIDGPMAGARLEPVTYTNAFWFGWREFRPDTRVVTH